MGYDFIKGASKADIVKAILSGGDKPDEYSAVAHKVAGRCLWVVWEHVSGDRNARFIGLYMLESERGFGWGYKEMSEAHGPSEYSCPLQFLEIVPMPQSPFAEAWRERVHAFHAEQGRMADVVKRAESGEQVSISDLIPRKPQRIVQSNCGECLMEHVEIVALDKVTGKCPCCMAGHKPGQPTGRTFQIMGLTVPDVF
jgi:hypothetical protein